MPISQSKSAPGSSKAKPKLDIYTDGACSGNPGPGGWGVYIEFGDKTKKLSGYEPETTNNRMELKAAIEALKILKKQCRINLYTDSIYVQQGITTWIHSWIKKGWRKSDNKPVKNADLWQELHELVTQHDVKWHWVKGHANSRGNNIADQLAVDAYLAHAK